MKIRMKHSAPLTYATPWSCGFDFCTKEEVTFEMGEWKLVDTGVVIEVPQGYVLLIFPRSSLFKHFWLIQTNGVWVIDQDYCGDDDTIRFPLLNVSGKKQCIPWWTRIGQGMFVPIEKVEFELVSSFWKQNRGGFGSTGLK